MPLATFLADGALIEDIPLEVFNGRAFVLEIPEDADCVEPQHLEALSKEPIERLLFKTRNSSTRWFEEPFNEKFVYCSPEAALLLSQRSELKLLGLDSFSFDAFNSDSAPSHHYLLPQNKILLEGLYLGSVDPGFYELLCLPLALKDGDGSPARALLRTTH